jgi:hypothetical protein
MKRSLLVPGLLTTAFLAMRCTGSDGGTGDGGNSDAGEGGSVGSGASAGNAGKAGAGAGTAGTAGSASNLCEPGESRACVGPGGCQGGQVCRPNGSGWAACDCGTGTGGGGGEVNTGGTGNAGSSGEAGDTSSGGTGGASEGGTGGESGAPGGGSSGEGGVGNTSGAAGAGAVSGNGGTSGAGGSGGTAGTAGLNCGATTGLELVPAPAENETAWVDRDANCLGIEGAIFTVEDGVGSDIYFTSRNGRLCMAGHAEQVVGGNFATYWGVFVSIQLNNVGGNAMTYDADANNVDGFKFTLSGDNVPAEIRPRFRVDGSGTEYCKQICESGTQSILLSDARASCWTGTTGATPNHQNLTLLEFQIPSNATADVTFDFCIDDIIAIQDNANVGNPGCGSGGSGGTGGTSGTGGTAGTSGAGAGGTSGGGTGGTGGGPDSCVGHCGGVSESENCGCDELCEYYEDCCIDYDDECAPMAR